MKEARSRGASIAPKSSISTPLSSFATAFRHAASASSTAAAVVTVSESASAAAVVAVRTLTTAATASTSTPSHGAAGRRMALASQCISSHAACSAVTAISVIVLVAS